MSSVKSNKTVAMGIDLASKPDVTVQAAVWVNPTHETLVDFITDVSTIPKELMLHK
ncbi:hypothetical protein [Ornithinibacillus xuwenensis]|uniref:Transposase n=1 Tax=Ornithinibacillus xuwenensis TaxID=3144668 RepID=A0ABU9XCA6_9BACI